MQSVEKTIRLLKDKIVTEKIGVEGVYTKETSYKKGSDLPAFDGSWQPFASGQGWGETRDTHRWFYADIALPKHLKGKAVRLCVQTDKTGWDAENPQFLAYIDGECKQGLDLNHTHLRVPNKEKFTLHLYAYSGTPSPHGNNGKFASTLEIAFESIDEETQGLYYDLRVPYEIACYLETDSEEYAILLEILQNACNTVRFSPEEYARSVQNARAYLQENLYAKKWHKDNPKIACIGHTHIDIAWMWTVAQAREKAQRSFATEVDLLKHNDDFYFTSSQPYLYQAVKEEAPALYEEIRALVAQGKWEAEGAAWLEFDCNVPCGESLVRQILYGKRFFKEEFGVESKILWLPDVFGYSGALPQILKKSGVDTFVTSKISWNDTNRLPNDIFRWKGIDGSEVLGYFISTTPKRRGLPVICGTGYVSVASPAEVAGTYERFEPKRLANELICCFGHGDGGGGVTQEMIEKVRRMTKGLPGCPTTEMKTVTQTLKDMRAKNEGKPLPIWRGELYLEFHRGTYTTRAWNKKYNRLCEELLKKAEWLYTMAFVNNGTPYPKETFERLWKVVLLNQFHDILPGSSIREVYEVTDAEYAQTVDELQGMIAKAEREIARLAGKDEIVAFNPASVAFGETIVDGETRFLQVPQKGYKAFPKEKKQKSGVRFLENSLENEWYRVAFNEFGQIQTLIYKPKNRNALKDGALGNALTAYEDIPAEYDAWNIDKDYMNKSTLIDDLISKEQVESGGKRGLKFRWRYGKSEIVQTVWLHSDIDRIDFETEVDWQAEHILLKTLFPLSVNTDEAVFEIQYGTQSRSTHDNTSWEQAQFEVPAQRYAYMKEKSFGVALLNDCKYGYSAKDGLLTLSLLRSTNYPCPNADRGKHSFTYSVYCGNEDFETEVLKHAESINKPITAVCGESETGALKEYSFLSCDKENIVIDAVKVAENGKDIIVRLYEATNETCECSLRFGFHMKKAWSCDLLENTEREISTDGNGVRLKVKPFEIITLKLEIV